MVYEVYKIQNSVNNKIYIGITNQGYKNRYRHHLSESRGGSTFILHNAIRKYGSDKFSVTLLETVDSIDSLKEREKFWISALDSTNRDKGYNMTEGGDGTFGRLHSDITKDKIREKALGRTNPKSNPVKITNLLTNEIKEYSSMWHASIGLNRNGCYIRDHRESKKSNIFTIDDILIEISEPIKRAAKPVIKTVNSENHMKMMQQKASEYIQNNKEEFSQTHKQLKLQSGKTKIIQQMTIDGQLVAEHLGSRDAAKAVSGNRSPIQHCLKGRIKTAYGFTWRYKLTS